MESGVPTANGDLTIKAFCYGASPLLIREAGLPPYPPDVFGLVGIVLGLTETYVDCMRDFNFDDRGAWPAEVKDLGQRWRSYFNARATGDGGAAPPAELQQAWETLRESWEDVELGDLHAPRFAALRSALLKLFVAADEACEGLGYYSAGSKPDALEMNANMRLWLSLEQGSTICSDVVMKSTVRVLPKLHVPRAGLSLRSLSRNLAVFPGLSIETRWHKFPPRVAEGAKKRAAPRNLNLLLVPFPMEVLPRQFESVGSGPIAGGSRSDRFFSYSVPGSGGAARDHAEVVDEIKSIYDEAARIDPDIHGVILPELAVTSAAYDEVRDYVVEQGSFLVSGVGDKTNGAKYETNELRGSFRWDAGQVDWKRAKHHRWRLDRSQVMQYGLGGRLHTQQNWWEHVELTRRKLGVFGLSQGLVLTTLICEDLAQQEPIGGLIRAIGPNLLVALLMDGPQLPTRWSARYAAGFADDPGCSVLSVTSLGMAALSRARGKGVSRAVALWKDALDGEATALDLPEGKRGIVLHLSLESRDECTADGRDGTAVYPVLGGVRHV